MPLTVEYIETVEAVFVKTEPCEEETFAKEEEEETFAKEEEEVNNDANARDNLCNGLKLEFEVDCGRVTQLQPFHKSARKLISLQAEHTIQDAPKELIKTEPDRVLHKCYICLNLFTDESTLFRHTCIPGAIETQTNVNLCELCLRKFNDTEALNVHKQKSHGTTDIKDQDDSNMKDRLLETKKYVNYVQYKRFLCEICNRRYKRRSGLNKHNKRMH